MFLSVIIPTRNRAATVSKAFESILKQTYPQSSFEVIAIDNGSTDDTKYICETFRNQIHHFRYIYEPEPGLHVGRHVGLNAAKGNILVYADDDIEAFPTWLVGIADAFEDDKVVLVGGKNLPKFEANPPEWLLKMWEKESDERKVLPYLGFFDLGDKLKEIDPYYVFGCNFSIRKSVLVEAEGFHPDSMPPEMIRFRGDGETHVSRYILKKGYKVLYHPKASVYHFVPKERMTFEYFYKRAYAQGISNSYTQIRKAGGVSRKHRIINRLRWLKSILEWKVKSFPNKSISHPEKEISSGYWNGFNYHQKEVREDKELLKWVLRKSYI